MEEKLFSILKLRFETIDAQKAIELSLELARLVKESGYKPEVIVCVNRGGMVISRLLSDFLEIRDVRSIRVEHYSIVEKEKKARVVEPLANKLNGEKVLLVDDVADTGESLRVAKDYLLKNGASEVRIATLHYKPWSSIKPEYFVKQTDRWIIYFWEMAETAKYLAQKLEKENLSKEEIKEALIKELGIPKEIVEWAVNRNQKIRD
jgi:hypoxanthine phosphoribosyltransferase